MSTVAQNFAEQPPVQTSIRLVDVPPEGYIKAPFGQVVIDKNGYMYIKYTKPTENTGWRLMLGVLVFNTKTELLAYTAYRHNDVAFTLGNTVKWDFGQGMGLYVYDSTDISVSDNATTANHLRPDNIATDATAGRWRCFEQASY